MTFLLVASGLLAAAIVRPIAGALIAGAVFAVTLWPLHERVSRRLGGRRQLSAYLLTLGVLLLIAVPIAPLSAFIVEEGSRGIEFITQTLRSEGLHGLIERLPEALRSAVKDALSILPEHQAKNLDAAVSQEVSASGGKAVEVVGSAVAATGTMLFHFAMMLIAFFVLLLQGDDAVRWLENASPLPPSQTRELLVDFKLVSYALVVATILTCAVQAGFALIGYLIAGVPHPWFFAALTFVIAFIPAIGAATVVEFAALLLLATNHPYSALFLALWGLGVVALVDNLIKPLLMRTRISMPGAVVFFALIGGLGAFGAVGLLIGPLAVSLLVSIVRMHQRTSLVTS